MKTRATPSIDRKRSRGRCPDGSANPVDIHVGKRLALRRKVLNFSQSYLAQHTGVTFQQVQKYEKGSNRIGASRLWLFAQLLGVDMNYFFQDMPQETVDRSLGVFGEEISPQPNFTPTPFEFTSEVQTFLGNYYKIAHTPVAKCLDDLLKALVAPQQYQSYD